MAKAAHQFSAEPEDGFVIGENGRREGGEVGPLIGTQQRISGCVVGIVGRQFDRQVQRFFFVFGAAREHLLADGDIAAMISRLADIDFHFFGERQSKETLGGGAAALIGFISCLTRPASCLADGATAAAVPPADPASQPASPQRERDYVVSLLESRKAYEAARTPKDKKAARVAMQIRVHELLALNQTAADWTGSVQDSGTTPEGGRWLRVLVGPDITLSTWQMTQFDQRDGTLIKPDTPLGQILDGVHIETPVVFSATLIGAKIAGDDDMVETPDTIARFSALKILQ